jgi:hypothetical protein
MFAVAAAGGEKAPRLSANLYGLGIRCWFLNLTAARFFLADWPSGDDITLRESVDNQLHVCFFRHSEVLIKGGRLQ